MSREFKGHQPDQNEPKSETREEIGLELKALEPYIYNICYGILHKNPHHKNDIDDVVQDTMIKAFNSWDAFKNESTRRTWITTIAVNSCRDYLRKSRVKFRDLKNANSVEDLATSHKESRRLVGATTGSPDYEAALTNKKIVESLLSFLSAEQKMLIRMQYEDDFSIEKIAKITGMNENTVKVKLFRARQKMLNIYTKQQKNIEKRPKIENPDVEQLDN